MSKIQETMVIVSSRSAGTLSVRRLIYKTVKRLIDILAGFAGCLLLIPLYFYVRYRNHRQGDRDPVIFTQERIGLHGKRITIYKFRSMIPNAEAVLEQLMKEDPAIREEYMTNKKLKHDPRITAVGAFLRKTSLDEFPQLFNVLKGDMSLVGPRPEVRKYVDLYTDKQKKVLSVRPGITDYASIEYVDENMILGEASDPDRAYIEQIMPDKIRYNMKYICNRSVKEYFKIIFLTFWSIIR